MGYLPLIYLQVLFLVLWWIIVFSWLFNIKRKKVICLILLEIILAVPIYFGYKVYSKKIALIKTENAILYAGPSEDYHKVKNVENAKEVEIKQKIGDWVKVYYDNIHGWLKVDDLTLL